jgi:hypothetical protein
MDSMTSSLQAPQKLVGVTLLFFDGCPPPLSFLLLKTCCGDGSNGHVVVVGCGVVLLSLSLHQVDTTPKMVGGIGS